MTCTSFLGIPQTKSTHAARSVFYDGGDVLAVAAYLAGPRGTLTESCGMFFGAVVAVTLLKQALRAL
jgi:hypothetical protein